MNILEITSGRLRYLIAVCGVFAIHIVIGWALFTVQPLLFEGSPRDHDVYILHLLDVPHPAAPDVTRPRRDRTERQLTHTRQTATTHTLYNSSIAITIPVLADPQAESGSYQPFEEAADFDTTALRQLCGSNYPGLDDASSLSGDLALLVWVEINGFVTDVRVIRSTGSTEIDHSIIQCLQTHATFEPTKVNRRSIAAWRKVVWMR